MPGGMKISKDFVAMEDKNREKRRQGACPPAVWPFFPLLKKKSGEKWKQWRIAQTPSEPGCHTVDISKYRLSAAGLSLYTSLSRLAPASSVSCRRISLSPSRSITAVFFISSRLRIFTSDRFHVSRSSLSSKHLI